MDVSVDEILRIRNMSESEVKSLVLEKLRQMKKQEFESWIRSKSGWYNWNDNIYLVIGKHDNIGMGTYSHVYDRPNTPRAIIAFSFSDRVQKEVYQNNLEYPDSKIVLLSVEELLDGITIEDKFEKLNNPGVIDRYFKRTGNAD